MKQLYRSFPLLMLGATAQHAGAAAIAVPDVVTMIRGSGSISIDVLANDDVDSDPEFSDISVGSFDQRSSAYGTVVRDGESNRLVYTPPSEAILEEDTFTYQAVDELGYGSSTTVTIVFEDSEPEPESNLESFAIGPTNKSIARMMDELCAVEGGGEGGESALGIACRQLFNATQEPAVLNAMLREIAPEEALTQRSVLSENARNKTGRLYRAMEQMRAGHTVSVSLNSHNLPLGGAAGDDLGSPWTLLSAIQIEYFERDVTGSEAGYDSGARALMLGLGYRMSNSVNLGGALDWATYDVDYRNDAGDLDSDIVSLTGFITWYRGIMGLDLQAGYSQGDSKAQRRFSDIDINPANSRYDSSQTNVSGQMDWTWQQNAWSLSPFIRLDYLNSEIDAFTETGASIWLMAVEKQQHEQVNVSAGLNTQYTINQSWGVLVPGLKLSLVNQNNLRNGPVAFQLVNAQEGFGRFNLRADSPDSLFYQWDLSTTFVLTNGLSTFFGAQLLSGYDDVSAHHISGGVNWEF